MNRHLRRLAVCASCVALAVCGCSRKPETIEDGAEVDAASRDAVADLINEHAELLAQGKADDALALLQSAVTNELYAEARADLLTMVVTSLVEGERFEEAREQLTRALASGEIDVGRCVMVIGEGLRGGARFEELEQWSGELLDTPGGDRAAMAALALRAEARLMLGRIDDAVETAMRAMQELDEGSAGRVMGYLLEICMKRRAWEDAGRMLKAIEDGPQAEPLRAIVVLGRSRVFFARGEWSAGADCFLENASGLTEKDLGAVLDSLTSAAGRARQHAVVDRLCEHVIAECPLVSEPVRRAALRWVQSASASGSSDRVMTRFVDLHHRGIPAGVQRALMQRYFYDIMKDAKPEGQREILGIVRALLAASEDETDQAALQAFAMDGAVMTEDYKLAREILQKGFRSEDAEWHAMALNKIEAHIAIQDGDIEEAIRRFRGFMNHAATWETSTSDPTTGIRHTREMTLGRNAKRIGDLYVSIGKQEEAGAVYAEARTYYDTALKNMPARGKERSLIELELREIPAEVQDKKKEGSTP